MTTNPDSTPDPAQGFTFPGMFDITAFGAADADLEAAVQERIECNGVTVLAGSQRARPSSAGHYIAVTWSFLCPDRATYEAVCESVRQHPAVKWTL